MPLASRPFTQTFEYSNIVVYLVRAYARMCSSDEAGDHRATDAPLLIYVPIRKPEDVPRRHSERPVVRSATRTEKTLYTIPGCTIFHFMQMSNSVPFGVMY